MATSSFLLLLSDSVLSNETGRIMPWRISSPAALCHVLELDPYPTPVFKEEAWINNHGALLVPAWSTALSGSQENWESRR